MGKWAELNGQVVVRKDKHLSLKKTIEAFLDEEDFGLSVYAPPFNNDCDYLEWYYLVEVSVEVDGYMAWKMFSELHEVLVKEGCKCDLRARIDL